ncbi:MAG TPA: polysaccharide deacetylase family protein [Bacillota bacterium]|nr:polysaccharide deacetylase family protein [Bacillota bacterium]
MNNPNDNCRLDPLFPGEIFYQGPPDIRSVALTFDDAPDNLFAPVLLDILAQYDVKATFFFLGTCVHQNPNIVLRMFREGHIIANHSYSHTDITTLTPEQIQTEVRETQDELQLITGLKTALFRPPFGALNAESAQVVISMGYKIILWNVDSLDWMGLTGPAITARVVSATVPGSIILMHNACDGTIQAGTGTTQSLPYIIEALRAEGYTFTTIPALLNIPAYQ